MSRNTDRSLYSILVIFTLVLSLLIVSRESYLAFINTEVSLREVLPRILINGILHTVISIFFAAFILTTTKWFFEKGRSHFFIISFHLVAAIFSIFFSYIIVVVSGLVIGTHSLAELTENEHLFIIIANQNTNLMKYFGFFGIIYTYLYIKALNESKLENLKTRERLTLTNLNLIKNQLEPHFLFNSLNTINSLIKSHPDKAIYTISSLGNVLRKTLALRDVQFVTVREEIEYIDTYYAVIQARFEDQVVIEKDIDELAFEKKIPSLILQPIVENAIKHGIKNGSTPLKIAISIHQKEKHLVINIKNDGIRLPRKFNLDDYSNTGLKLIKERFLYLFDDDFEFTLKNTFNNSYSVEAYISLGNPRFNNDLPT